MTSKCLSNCETCDYKKINQDPDLWCYMFKDAPEGECAQHSGNKEFEKQLKAAFGGGRHFADNIINLSKLGKACKNKQ